MPNLARQLGVCVTASMFATAASCSAASPSAPSGSAEARRSGRIVVLGDSLAVTPTRAESFPTLLQARLDAAGGGWSIVNAGVSGDTTAGGLARFDTAVDRSADVLVLELGANDGLRGIDVSTIERNLAAIILRAQSRGMRVLLCGMETPPTNGWDYTVAFHEVFPRVAERYDVPLVPFLLAGVALRQELNGPDGIHPNAAGARRIAETVWPFLEMLVSSEAQQPAS